jgi:GTP-binding protein LepA
MISISSPPRPSVVYRIHLTHSTRGRPSSIELHNPADMPDPNRIATIEEPWIEATIYVPTNISAPSSSSARTAAASRRT